MNPYFTINRMSPPTKQDTAERGTHCFIKDDNKFVWVQVSSDEEDPLWVEFEQGSDTLKDWENYYP